MNLYLVPLYDAWDGVLFGRCLVVTDGRMEDKEFLDAYAVFESLNNLRVNAIK